VALTEQGQVYTWGRGVKGRLANGSESSEVMPFLVKFNFDSEESKIKQTKKKLV
jgi:alpha-tubulin suppressor-like RCC1 family protein